MRLITAQTLQQQPSWPDAVAALSAGHHCARPLVDDVFQTDAGTTLLSRAATIPGLGAGVKSVTVRPDNAAQGRPTVQGGMLVFSADTGALLGLVDSALITKWKTAADSVLGARLLARPDIETLLIIGAGAVARSIAEAYFACFPSLARILIHNRTTNRAEAACQALSDAGLPVAVAADLRAACRQADVIATATLSSSPVLPGDMVRPGTHVDLIGAFKADMREADDALLRAGRLFVDSRETTITHIGELLIPIAAGVIGPEHVLADLYDLLSGGEGRTADEDITIFKNGGGAHLDLMTAHYLMSLAAPPDQTDAGVT